MRSLPLQLTQELQSEVCSIGHLVEIILFDPSTQQNVPLYFTDTDMDVVWDPGDGEKTWVSIGMEFSDGQQSLSPKVDSVTFELDNTALLLSSYIMNYETRGKECTIYRAAFDKYLQVLGATVLFPGILDRVELDNRRARIECANAFIKWSTQTPRRKHSATCPWTFKGSECGYSGELTSCDKSWDACVERERTASNGSYRFVTDLEAGKNVVWGRNPTV